MPLLPSQSTKDRFKHDLAALIDRYRTVLEAEYLATLLTSEIERLGSPIAARGDWGLDLCHGHKSRPDARSRPGNLACGASAHRRLGVDRELGQMDIGAG